MAKKKYLDEVTYKGGQLPEIVVTPNSEGNYYKENYKDEVKAERERHAKIAKRYLSKTPSLINRLKYNYHRFKSTPLATDAYDVMGRYAPITGIAPSPSIASSAIKNVYSLGSIKNDEEFLNAIMRYRARTGDLNLPEDVSIRLHNLAGKNKYSTKLRMFGERLFGNNNGTDVPTKTIEGSSRVFQKGGNRVYVKMNDDGTRSVINAEFFNPKGDPNEFVTALSKYAKKGDTVDLFTDHYSLSTNSAPWIGMRLAKDIANPTSTGYKIVPTHPIYLNDFGGTKVNNIMVPEFNTPSVQTNTINKLKRIYTRLLNSYNSRNPESPINFNMDDIYYDSFMDKYVVPGFKATKLKSGGIININNMPNYLDVQKAIVQKVNSSKANFVKRLKDPNRKTIKDWENKRDYSTHKLSVGQDNKGRYFIYPEVQEINGTLEDFTRPPYTRFAGQQSAVERGDTVQIPSFEDALRFTETYKNYYPKFKSGGIIHINPANRGKFNATKERTGKTTEELTHSKNPLTRKRAIFAQNAAKWNH